MKKILVPTDFSKNAENALIYAIEMANEYGATIVLVHTYLVKGRTGSFAALEKNIKENAKNAMAQLVQRVASKLGDKVEVKSEIIYGDSVSLVARIATNYDLVVMGTKGAKGMVDVMIGSTAAAVIRDAETPVLVIPDGAKFTKPEKIVFAFDNLPITQAASVEVLKIIADQFKSHIHLYHFDISQNSNGIDPKIASLFNGIKISFYHEIGGKNLNHSIKKFSKNNGANMLGMLRRKRGFWKSLFHNSATKQEVFSGILPILILSEK